MILATRRAKMPVIDRYVDYRNDNYGLHSLHVDFGIFQVWFSYTTAVAFWVDGHEIVVVRNYWGPTTGKHLNSIPKPRHHERVSMEEFQRLWNEQVGPLLGDEPIFENIDDGDAGTSNRQDPPVRRPLPRLVLDCKNLND